MTNMIAFIDELAKLPVDGEPDGNGNETEWENDNAVDTLFDVIAQARSLTPTVHVVSIDHRHGTTVLVHSTHEGANNALHQWVLSNWTKSTPPPDSITEAIEAYFDDFSGESYWITEETVQP
jgi:hypothetical protein